MAKLTVATGVRKNFIFPKELNARLLEYADANYLSQNQVVIMAVNQFLLSNKMSNAFANMSAFSADDFKRTFSETLIEGLKNEGLVVPSDEV